jgi:hypothetical protein
MNKNTTYISPMFFIFSWILFRVKFQIQAKNKKLEAVLYFTVYNFFFMQSYMRRHLNILNNIIKWFLRVKHIRCLIYFYIFNFKVRITRSEKKHINILRKKYINRLKINCIFKIKIKNINHIYKIQELLSLTIKK